VKVYQVGDEIQVSFYKPEEGKDSIQTHRYASLSCRVPS